MGRPKKQGRRDVLHIGDWAAAKLRADAAQLGLSMGEVASEILESFYATLDMRHVPISDPPSSSSVCLRLSPEARVMLHEIAAVTGVHPSSALNVILLWAYLTREDKSSIPD